MKRIRFFRVMILGLLFIILSAGLGPVDIINHSISTAISAISHLSPIGALPTATAGTAPKLGFPLRYQTPFSAIITAVFDHSMAPVTDKKTGELISLKDYCPDPSYPGVLSYDGINATVPTSWSILYTKDCNGDGKKETVQLYAFTDRESGKTLYYDGHPGYDYATQYPDYKKTSENEDPPNGRIDVLAAADGIAYAPKDDAYGEVYIDHDNGWRTRYFHLSDRIDQTYGYPRIGTGYQVKKGDKIGVSGNAAPPGLSTGSHLHFEVRKADFKRIIPIDPYSENLWDSEAATVSTPSTPTGFR